MKMHPEHLASLKAAVEPLDTPERRALYLAGDFPRADLVTDLSKRYRWDLFWVALGNSRRGADVERVVMYDYQTAHIDTALRSLVPALVAP